MTLTFSTATLEGLVELLRLQLQLKQGPVHSVHHQHWLACAQAMAWRSTVSVCTHTPAEQQGMRRSAAREGTAPGSKPS